MKVSVCMITYNHEKFIAQAIESVLMQQTNFDYEIVIGEDCSPDNTKMILREYQARYPHKRFNLLLRERNLGMLYNFVDALNHCSGEYIALLEGDDYWTDSLKLQKQVTFLDSYRECSLCFHPVIQEFGLGRNLIFPSLPCKERYTLEDLIDGDFIPTSSSMFRNGLVREFPDWYFQMSSGDYQLFIFLAQRGMIGLLSEVMAVYRVHRGGVWSGLNTIMKLRTTIKHLAVINEYLKFQYDSIVEKKISYYYFQLSTAYCNEYMKRNAVECLYKSLKFQHYNRAISAKEMIKLLLKLLVPGLLRASRYFRKVFNRP